MNKDTILSIVRHALTFGGGLLVTKGIASESIVETAIAAVITLVGAVWGAVDEHTAAEKAKAEAAAKAATTTAS